MPLADRLMRPVIVKYYAFIATASTGQATVLSGASMVYSLVTVPLSVGVKPLADAQLSAGSVDVAGSPLAAIGIAGVALVVATLVAYAGGGSVEQASVADAN